MSNQFPPAGTRIAIYVRCASPLQVDDALACQVAANQAFAAIHGWVVTGIFQDGNKSGMTLVGRDGFFAMVAAAERGEFTLVLTEDLSRLSRSARDTYELCEMLHDLGVGICTIANSRIIDGSEAAPASPVEETSMQAAVRHALRDHQSRAETSEAPFGYKNVRRGATRMIDPEEAVLVRRLFQAFNAGV